MSTVNFFELDSRPKALAYERRHFSKNAIRRLRFIPGNWRTLPVCHVPEDYQVFWRQFEKAADEFKHSAVNNNVWLDQVLTRAWQLYEELPDVTVR